MSVISKYWKIRKYQKDILNDKSRLIAVVKARQIGLTELASVMSILIALSGYKKDVWLLGVNHEGAKEILLRARNWYSILKLEIPNLPDLKTESTECLTFGNHSRITALPCSARAVRGKTGVVIMDEAAHYQDDEAIWTAIAPVISSSPKLKLIMFSTPFGERGVFWRAVNGKLDGKELKWSVHHVDVHRAIDDGFSKEVLDLRSTFTADQWAQEFLCSFLSQADKYFTADLISSCYEKELAPDEERIVERKILGIDLASKRDQSITIECDFDGEDCFRFHNINVLSTRKNPKTYPEQFEVIKDMIKSGSYYRVIVDATGPGAGLAQFLKAQFGNLIIEHNSTMQWKQKYIPALKVDMEAKKVELQNEENLIKAFNAVKETRSSANNIIYSMARDEIDHADVFAASVMAYSVVKKFPTDKQAPAIFINKSKDKTNERY